ncbi:MAG: endopeptidase La [Cytophagales bacterium]|nr:MAG: endopeptidase La [Cytophagales bacterium]
MFNLLALQGNEEQEESSVLKVNIDDENMSSEYEKLSILPLRNAVLFPGVVIPVTVGRKKSIKLVKKAYKGDKIIGVSTQRQNNIEDPHSDDLYKVGTVAQILKLFNMPDGNVTILIQGKNRFEIGEILTEEPYLESKINILTENFPSHKKGEGKALMSSLKEKALQITELNNDIPREARITIDNIESLSFLTHFLCSNFHTEMIDKQTLLEINDGEERATKLLEFLQKEIQLLEIKKDIQSKAFTDIDQQQRDYFLRQQMKVIQDELKDESNEVEELKLKAKNKKWNDKTAKHFEKEIGKLSRTNQMSPDYPLLFNYLETLVDLPWADFSDDSYDLKKAKEILDTDHSGIEKVKERIIEYLAVLKLKKNLKSPILCLYGPPGVGKTSLGKSIAKALNRQYARIALGGLHDEAEIRGHRRTYIGAMPGRIVQNLKKTQTSNPVFILDELDKVASNVFRGDPASALLEVLDPEQNHSFVDNYVEVEYDLSNVLFIATANSLDTIHPALRDRLEIIELSGYTTEEKLDIAKTHLIAEQRIEHGLKPKDIKFDDASLIKIIEDYTRESGVRNLKRQIGAVCRKIAKFIAAEEKYNKNITPKEIKEFLGAEPFDREKYQNITVPGIVTGLAWTQVGGEILFIEAIVSAGKGKMTISGQLGDVMKESVNAALSYFKSIAHQFNIKSEIFDKLDLHVHVPAGAVPKDGPSAGIAMLTALTSVFTRRKVKQHLAMTGEITLTGRVLPVGGIKEKILAAKRAGIKEIIMCHQNKKDIEEINALFLDDLKINYVSKASEVLALALEDEISGEILENIIGS